MVGMLTAADIYISLSRVHRRVYQTCCRFWVFWEVLDHSSVEGGLADSGSGCKRLHKGESVCVIGCVGLT